MPALDFSDIAIVNANWGGAGPAGDYNSDGIVDFNDILYILANWNPPSPSVPVSRLLSPASSPLGTVCGLACSLDDDIQSLYAVNDADPTDIIPIDYDENTWYWEVALQEGKTYTIKGSTSGTVDQTLHTGCRCGYTTNWLVITSDDFPTGQFLKQSDWPDMTGLDGVACLFDADSPLRIGVSIPDLANGTFIGRGLIREGVDRNVDTGSSFLQRSASVWNGGVYLHDCHCREWQSHYVEYDGLLRCSSYGVAQHFMNNVPCAFACTVENLDKQGGGEHPDVCIWNAGDIGHVIHSGIRATDVRAPAYLARTQGVPLAGLWMKDIFVETNYLPDHSYYPFRLRRSFGYLRLDNFRIYPRPGTNVRPNQIGNNAVGSTVYPSVIGAYRITDTYMPRFSVDARIISPAEYEYNKTTGLLNTL